MEEKVLTYKEEYKQSDGNCTGDEGVFRNCSAAFRAEYSTICGTNGTMAGTEICNQFQECDKHKTPGEDKHIYSMRTEMNGCPATCCMEKKRTLKRGSASF